jgi:general secretion pathway protein G
MGPAPAFESVGQTNAVEQESVPGSTRQGLTTMRLTRDQRGWTLIELMVVVSLIAVLAAIALANYHQAVITTQEAVLKEDLFRLRDAIDQYYADKNKYPESLESLVSDGYLRKIPEDPFTRSAETWQPVPAEPDPANPTAEPGIYDVKSGSDKASIAGTPYAEW